MVTPALLVTHIYMLGNRLEDRNGFQMANLGGQSYVHPLYLGFRGLGFVYRVCLLLACAAQIYFASMHSIFLSFTSILILSSLHLSLMSSTPCVDADNKDVEARFSFQEIYIYMYI